MNIFKGTISTLTFRSSGMSLLGITIAAGVTSVLMLGALQIAGVASKSGKAASALNDYFEMKNYVFARIKNSSASHCHDLLSPVSLTSLPVHHSYDLLTGLGNAYSPKGPYSGMLLGSNKITALTLYADNSNDSARLDSSGTLINDIIYQLSLKNKNDDCALDKAKNCRGDLYLSLYRRDPTVADSSQDGAYRLKSSEILGSLSFFVNTSNLITDCALNNTIQGWTDPNTCVMVTADADKAAICPVGKYAVRAAFVAITDDYRATHLFCCPVIEN
jgi:hypothetical protein